MSPVGEPLRMVLELAPGKEPVEGSLTFGPGKARAFTGWIELVAALESAIEGADPRPDGGRGGLNPNER